MAFISTIYRLGRQNLVYLGEDDEGVAEDAIRAINVVLDDMSVATDGFTRVEEVIYLPNGQWAYSEECLPPGLDFLSLAALSIDHGLR